MSLALAPTKHRYLNWDILKDREFILRQYFPIEKIYIGFFALRIRGIEDGMSISFVKIRFFLQTAVGRAGGGAFPSKTRLNVG